MLAWGYDTYGEGCHVVYETPVARTGAPAGLDILSRSECGPSTETLKGIYSALVQLNNAELTGLVHSSRKLVVDGKRSGSPPVACDTACVNNTYANLPPIP